MNLYAPKKFKSLKLFKRPNFQSLKTRVLRYGFYGIQALGFCCVTGRQLEAGRRYLTRKLSRRATVWRLRHLTQPLTQKPKLSRMGKGKGRFKMWIGYVQPGLMLYEMGYIPSSLKSNVIKTITEKERYFSSIKHKFSIPVKVIVRKTANNLKYKKNMYFKRKKIKKN